MQDEVVKLGDCLEKYANINFELIKHETSKQTSNILSGLFANIAIGFIVLLSLVFASFGTAYYLSAQIGHEYAGFLIVAAFYLLIATFLILSRKKVLRKPIRNQIIKSIYQDN